MLGSSFGAIVEMVEWKYVDVCCIQVIKWRTASTRFLTCKEQKYKFFWEGNNVNVMGILLAKKWVDRIRMLTLI